MNEKILIIGFGFIGGYLSPCYRELLREVSPETVFAVKATDRNLQVLRERYPYSISAGDTAAVLERERPTVLVLCPPPELVPEITADILAP